MAWLPGLQVRDPKALSPRCVKDGGAKKPD